MEIKCECGAVLKQPTGARQGRHYRSKRHQRYERMEYEKRRRLIREASTNLLPNGRFEGASEHQL